jgi:agmatine/peptidylarginine deiminase
MLMALMIPLLAESPAGSGISYAWERFTQTPPPQSPVRPVAEFEPASHVMIRYPLGLPSALVAQLSNTVDVICLVSSNSQQNSAINSFSNAGVDMDRVSFMIASTDSYWTRDYGPWFVYDGNGEYGVLDFQYNRPRPGDNMVPQTYANNLDLPYYGMNLQQTGGNYMTDGINTAAQTQIAYSENGNNQNNVDTLMEQYLGISSYHVVQDPNNTYIDHIDCWGKFLAPDKVLIRSVPSSHPQYNAIEATADYFAQQISAWGYPYRVYRVNTPQNQPYTNSLILNKRVFVPIMNSSYDAAALQVYAEAMPGYEIIGVPGSPYTPWESTDALHCRTHEIPDAQMLHIAHMPYYGVKDFASEYEFEAVIVAHSGMDLVADSLNVVYQIGGGDWQNSPLIAQTAYDYVAEISGHAPGDTIRYYIEAKDQSGRSRTHPSFAALDPHTFVVYGDGSGPELIHNPFCSVGEDEITFVVNASDESGIEQIALEYRVDNGEVSRVEMMEAGGGVYLYSLFPDFSFEDEYFMYRITGIDNLGNATYLPAQGEWFSVAITYLDNNDDLAVPGALSLKLYPNPMRNTDELKIILSEGQDALKLQIFNLKGQLVLQDQIREAQSEYIWNGRDKNGEMAPNGIYFIRVSGRNVSLNRKFIKT